MQRILPSFGLKGHNMYTIGLGKYFFRPLMQISGAQRQFSSVLLITVFKILHFVLDLNHENAGAIMNCWVNKGLIKVCVTQNRGGVKQVEGIPNILSL